MGNATPYVSVIVATRNRAYGLVPCMESILNAFGHARITRGELIIVDNGSTDHTAEVVEMWAAQKSFTVKLVSEPIAGLSRARNAGMAASSGKLLVFTDDDCRMSESYIAEALRYDSCDKELVIRSGSVVLGDPTDLPITIKEVQEIKSWKRPLSSEGEGQLLGCLIGCNMLMRREAAELIGEFDTTLGAGTPCPAGEDTDYFYRAYLAGMRLEMVPDMIVAHWHGRKTVEERIKLYRNYAIGNTALAMKYLTIYPPFAKHIWWDIRRTVPKLFSHYPGVTITGKLSPRSQLECIARGIVHSLAIRIRRSVRQSIAG